MRSDLFVSDTFPENESIGMLQASYHASLDQECLFHGSIVDRMWGMSSCASLDSLYAKYSDQLGSINRNSQPPYLKREDLKSLNL